MEGTEYAHTHARMHTHSCARTRTRARTRTLARTHARTHAYAHTHSRSMLFSCAVFFTMVHDYLVGVDVKTRLNNVNDVELFCIIVITRGGPCQHVLIIACGCRV